MQKFIDFLSKSFLKWLFYETNLTNQYVYVDINITQLNSVLNGRKVLMKKKSAVGAVS